MWQRSALALSFLLAGCSSLGDLQVWNDAGPKGKAVGQALRTYDSTCKVLTGHSCGNAPLNAAQANRTLGQIKQMPYHIKHGLPPQKVTEIQELMR